MDTCKPISTPMQPNIKLSKEMTLESNVEEEMTKIPYFNVVGNLMFCMVCTKHNIAFVVGTIVQFMSSPIVHHWGSIEKILQYLQSTRTFGIKFKRNM
jgi:hypothetical protein